MSSPALRLLAFLHRWDGGSLSVNVLSVPLGSPVDPLAAGQPAFADATLALEARMIPSLDRLPRLADVSATMPLTLTPPPNPRGLFEQLAQSVPVVAPTPATSTPRRPGRAIKKLVMPSYMSATGFAPLRVPEYAVTDDSYECALNCASKPAPPSAPRPVNDWTWGRLIALALRQPLLAKRLGLVHELVVTPATADFYKYGGWLFVTLASGSPFSGLAAPASVATYAARVPELSGPRPLFSRVLFPVLSAPPALPYDELIAEAEAYDDGFARVVHAAQQRSAGHFAREDDGTLPSAEFGIRLGWDDEDVLISFNRQITTDPAQADLNAPLGVARYRVDVRRSGTTPWFSLNRTKGELRTASVDLGTFEGESGIDLAPVQPQGLRDGEYWLPAYFTQWTGRSVVGLDPDEQELLGKPLDPSGLQPVEYDKVPLRYGQSYDFRVRLVDITGAGPLVEDGPVNPAPAPVTTWPFRRYVPPGPVRLDPAPGPVDPLAPPTHYVVRRPRLGYPGLVHTGWPNAIADLKADRTTAKNEQRPIGLPDPDVDTLEITVEVRGPELDEGNDSRHGGPYRVLYRTERPFPANPSQPLTLKVKFQDAHTLTGFPTPTSGPVPLPSGREVRLWLAPVCRTDPELAYFGCDEARYGRAIVVATRQHSAEELGLLTEDTSGSRLRGIFLQPEPHLDNQVAYVQKLAGAGFEAPSDAIGLLAQQLQLDVHKLTLSARAGERATFGCAQGIRHTLSPDHAKIGFASKAELTGQWLVALTARLQRDWTWDMLREVSFTVERTLERDGEPPTVEEVGTLELRRTVNALTRTRSQRDFTRLVFFDAIDGNPRANGFPRPIRVSYTLKPAFAHPPAKADITEAIQLVLPVTTSPRQVPRIVSAGLAFSPYERSATYDTTEPRHKVLWVEFEQPPADDHDAVFCRVVASAPDPMLLAERSPVADTTEPPLPLAPEPMRVIVPGASDDSAGRDAMQMLVPGTSSRHYVVPLPPGLEPGSAELFGFFTYEFRIGHSLGWSTAQGRFGRPLRVTGVQHPAPTLPCVARRLPEGIVANAPYALPVHEGVSRLPRTPNTELWMVLYAQVTRVDGEDHSNLLLATRRMRPLQDHPQQGDYALPHGGSLLGEADISNQDIRNALENALLDDDAPLSVLAVELLPESIRVPDPLGAQLGQVRILRASPLTSVESICTPC